MDGIKGLSIIYHSNAVKYIGKYIAGLFSDNNYKYRSEDMKGWGFKLDLYVAPLVRPVPKFWKKSFWTMKPPIYEKYDTGFFTPKLQKKLENKRRFGSNQTGYLPHPKEVNDFKFGIHNPWKGQYWFVLRVPKLVPYVFFSLSTPWKSFYIGFKTSKIEPFLTKPCMDEGKNPIDQGDYTWCDKNEEKLAREAGGEMFRSAVPSASFRSNRK